MCIPLLYLCQIQGSRFTRVVLSKAVKWLGTTASRKNWNSDRFSAHNHIKNARQGGLQSEKPRVKTLKGEGGNL
jgi:hypothetical protein